MNVGPKGRFRAQLDDFSAGLSTSSNPLKSPMNSSPKCMNVYSTGTSRYLSKRLGNLRINSSAAAETTANGMLDFGPSITTGRKLVVQFGTRIYKMDDLDGTLDQIQTGRTDGQAQMVNYTATNDYIIIADSGGLPPQKWDGQAATTSAVDSTAPIAKHPFSFVDRLFFSGIQNEKIRVRYSDINSLNFPTTNFFDVVNPESAEPTGWGYLRGTAFIFFPHSIFKLSHLGGSPLFDLRIAVNGVGSVSPKTVRNIIIGGSEYIVFLGSDKRFYLFDGFTVKSVSDSIDEDNGISTISTPLLNDHIDEAHSIVDTKGQRYITWVPVRDSTNPDHCLVMDYSAGVAWWPYDNQDFGASAVALDSLNRTVMVTADYSGRVHRWANGQTDDGTTISSEWTSQKLTVQEGQALHKMRKVKLYTSRVGNANLSFYSRSDLRTGWGDARDVKLYSEGDYFLGTTFILGTSTLGSSYEPTTELDLAKVENHVEFRLTEANVFTPWKLQRIEFHGMLLGSGRGAEEGNAA